MQKMLGLYTHLIYRLSDLNMQFDSYICSVICACIELCIDTCYTHMPYIYQGVKFLFSPIFSANSIFSLFFSKIPYFHIFQPICS